MCDPVTLILGAAGMAAGAMSLGSAQAAPPPAPAMPAMTSPETSVKDPDIRVGSDDETPLSGKQNQDAGVFQRRRVSASTFGNLGQSALAI